MRNTFVETLLVSARKDKDIVLITGDLGFGVLTEFWEELPNQFINAGIAEQNMASVAAGMALEGKNVFIYSIANFPTLRCIEQIRNDIAYHNARVTIVSVGAGLAYGSSGMSHHATEDIAMMRALSGMMVFTPCDPVETEQVTQLAIASETPCYIRLGRGGERNLHAQPVTVQIGLANMLRSGDSTAILVAGAVADEALAAAEILETKGISCAVYSFPTIKPLDETMIKMLASKHRCIFTLEEHTIVGGFGGAVCEVVAGMGVPCKIIRLGLQDVYTSVVGSQSYLRKYYELDASAITTCVQKQWRLKTPWTML